MTRSPESCFKAIASLGARAVLPSLEPIGVLWSAEQDASESTEDNQLPISQVLRSCAQCSGQSGRRLQYRVDTLGSLSLSSALWRQGAA